MVALPLTSIAKKHAGSVAHGLSFVVGLPYELPRTAWFLVQYVWHSWVRRKRMVAIVRLGGLGDLVCLLACAAGLRRRHPNSWLLLISPPGCAQLAVSSGVPDVTVEAKSLVGRLMVHFPSVFSCYWPLLPDEYNPPRAQVLHLADEFGRALGVPADLSGVSLRVPERVRRRVVQRLIQVNPERQPVVVLHPGPSWPVREWPSQRWCELASIISARMPALIIKIGTDRDSMSRVRPFGLISNAVDWTNQLDVMEIAALIEQASVFIGIDSGPLHIAGVLRVPSVGLFGPISGKLRLHPAARTTIVSGELDCLGCHHSPTGQLHWKTGCPNDIACMREITAEAVFAAVAEHIGIRHRAATPEC